MDRSPYINAIVAIVVIVAIVLFVDLYLQMPQERTAGEAMQQLNMITGAVVANSQCSTCVCIQQMPYTNGPLSFAASPSTCSNSFCQAAGSSQYGHSYWMARLRSSQC